MPLLATDEARHNLILGLATTLRDQPDLYPEKRFWLVRDQGEVVAAALRTPPQNLVLARPSSAAALEALVAGLDDEPPGVVGALPEAERFAAAWAARTGCSPQRRFSQAIYVLEQVRPVRAVGGRLRAARHEDMPLIVDWLCAFGAEALREEAPDLARIERSIVARLEATNAGIALWDDDGAVSLAGFGGETPSGIRIGPVYTPPQQRGRGYATALVAQLSADLLAVRRRFCFLYTDLANPTSNRIYQRIGYQHACDSAEIALPTPS